MMIQLEQNKKKTTRADFHIELFDAHSVGSCIFYQTINLRHRYALFILCGRSSSKSLDLPLDNNDENLHGNVCSALRALQDPYRCTRICFKRVSYPTIDKFNANTFDVAKITLARVRASHYRCYTVAAQGQSEGFAPEQGQSTNPSYL